MVLYGGLFTELGRGSIYREFHNRMYVDYTTSCLFGELHPDHVANGAAWKQGMRPLQHRAIKKMGFHKPCSDAQQYTVVTDADLALISIPVVPRKR